MYQSHLLIVQVECQGMACEVSGVSVKTELVKQLLHRLILTVEAFPRLAVVRVVLLDVDEQRTESSFLKQAHQSYANSVTIC